MPVPLQFLDLANGIIEGLPRARSRLADQFTRASLAIVLNGRRRRQALEARQAPVRRDRPGVADESGALLDVCVRLELLDEGVKVHSISVRDFCSSLS